MSATTTEGTGLGSVERLIPRIYNHQIIQKFEQVQQIAEVPPSKIDGGELKILSLSDEDRQIILKAAEILKKIS